MVSVGFLSAFNSTRWKSTMILSKVPFLYFLTYLLSIVMTKLDFNRKKENTGLDFKSRGYRHPKGPRQIRKPVLPQTKIRLRPTKCSVETCKTSVTMQMSRRHNNVHSTCPSCTQLGLQGSVIYGKNSFTSKLTLNFHCNIRRYCSTVHVQPPGVTFDPVVNLSS